MTDRLADGLRGAGLTGWSVGTVHVSRSDELASRRPDLELPRWSRLLPTGTEGDDIVLLRRVYLCVSERALQLLRDFSIDHARVRDVSAIPPPIV